MILIILKINNLVKMTINLIVKNLKTLLVFIK